MGTLQDLFWIIGIIVGLLTIFEKMNKSEKSDSAPVSPDVGAITQFFESRKLCDNLVALFLSLFLLYVYYTLFIQSCK